MLPAPGRRRNPARARRAPRAAPGRPGGRSARRCRCAAGLRGPGAAAGAGVETLPVREHGPAAVCSQVQAAGWRKARAASGVSGRKHARPQARGAAARTRRGEQRDLLAARDGVHHVDRGDARLDHLLGVGALAGGGAGVMGWGVGAQGAKVKRGRPGSGGGRGARRMPLRQGREQTGARRIAAGARAPPPPHLGLMEEPLMSRNASASTGGLGRGQGRGRRRAGRGGGETNGTAPPAAPASPTACCAPPPAWRAAEPITPRAPAVDGLARPVEDAPQHVARHGGLQHLQAAVAAAGAAAGLARPLQLRATCGFSCPGSTCGPKASPSEHHQPPPATAAPRR
jgi:hypothetical protein